MLKFLKNLASFIRSFFWWSAGVVPQVLEKCPTNQARYTAIGVIMVFIALLACFSFAFFLAATFNSSVSAALIGGAAWGVLIYSLDRVVLTSFRKNETGVISIAQRFLLTVSLALIIGEPLLLQLFEKEIALELKLKSQTISAVSREKATQRFAPEVESLENRNRAIENRLDALKRERDEKEQAVIGETEGTTGSGRAGFGEAAKMKQKAFAEADAKYLRDKADAAQSLSENRARLAQIRDEIEKEIGAISQTASKSDGVLAKHAALFNLVRTQPGAALVYLPLFLGILFLETLPLSLKVFGKKSVYDVALEAEEAETAERLETDRQRRQDTRNAVEERISSSIATGTIDALRDPGERRAAKLMKSEILRKIEDKLFERRSKTAEFGAQIMIEVVGQADLQITLQLPETARREISLDELSADTQAIAREIGGEDLRLQTAFSSRGHEIWRDLPLLPQLEADQKLILQFESASVT